MTRVGFAEFHAALTTRPSPTTGVLPLASPRTRHVQELLEEKPPPPLNALRDFLLQAFANAAPTRHSAGCPTQHSAGCPRFRGRLQAGATATHPDQVAPRLAPQNGATQAGRLAAVAQTSRRGVLALVALAPRVEWESWPQAVRVLTTGRARGIFPGAKPSEPQVEA